MKWILFKIFIFTVAFASNEKTKINGEPNPELIAKWLKHIYLRVEETLKVRDECMVCYECFPVSLQLPCRHEICAVCAESIFKFCNNTGRKCPLCRAPFPKFASDMLNMIKIKTIYLTPDTSLEKLQLAFPLICSVANLTTVAQCVKMGIDINTKGILGFFPVHLASKKDILQYLLDNGANVNQARFDGVTPLYWRSENGNLPLVKYLVEKRANVNQPNNYGFTPLSLSSEKGHLSVVKYLIENGADVDHCNNKGETSLFKSSYEGHLLVVQYLVENGANVNSHSNRGSTPLHVSSQEGHLLVVKYLVENGGNVNQHNHLGMTPLESAINFNYMDVAKFLLKKNANIQAAKLFFTNLNFLEHINRVDKLVKEMEESKKRKRQIDETKLQSKK